MAKFELPKLKTADEIKSDQDVIHKNLSSLDLMIHDNMVQCLMHCAQHRDTSLMVRLLVDVVDADKTGYRRQSMIAWMKFFSPMRLSGKTIKLSGKTADGKEQPFNVEQAAQTKFWELVKEGPPVIRPMFQDNFLGQINNAIKAFQRTAANTTPDGKPIDPAKPFYDGKHLDTMNQFMIQVKQLEAVIPLDDTKEVRTAQRKQAELKAA